MGRFHSKKIEATVVSVKLDPNIKEEKLIWIDVMCLVAFTWKGVPYQKEVGPIRESDDLKRLPEVGSRIKVHFHPGTGECFVDSIRRAETVGLAKGFASILAKVVAMSLAICLLCVFFKRIAPEKEVGIALISLVIAVCFLVMGVVVVIDPIRFDRQLRDGQFRRISGKFTGKYMRMPAQGNVYTIPVYEYRMDGKKHYMRGRPVYDKSSLSAGELITLYQNIDTKKVQQEPEKPGFLPLFFLAISLPFFWASYITWMG